jgi:hypothetical protein
MSKDPYANYVVKTAMEVLEEGKQRDQLYAVLLSHQAKLVSSFPFHTVVNTSKRDPHFGPFFRKMPAFLSQGGGSFCETHCCDVELLQAERKRY